MGEASGSVRTCREPSRMPSSSRPRISSVRPESDESAKIVPTWTPFAPRSSADRSAPGVPAAPATQKGSPRAAIFSRSGSSRGPKTSSPSSITGLRAGALCPPAGGASTTKPSGRICSSRARKAPRTCAEMMARNTGRVNGGRDAPTIARGSRSSVTDPAGAPSTSIGSATGCASASRSRVCGMSRGTPAPIRTTSTPAIIAPSSVAGVESWIFSRQLMPTSPSCPSLASQTSANAPSTTSSVVVAWGATVRRGTGA